MPETHIRIFLSSPGDVTVERDIARDLVKDTLPYAPFIRGRATFDVISWDDPHASPGLSAHLTPQQAINKKLKKPSECDVVIVILWGRMGTPLPSEIARPDGTAYQSGTEWEFEDALKAANENGKPEILLYRRTEKPRIDVDDPELEAKRSQYQKVEAFFTRFQGAGGSLTGSFNEYATPDGFRELLRQNLESVVNGFLVEEVAGLQQELDEFKCPHCGALMMERIQASTDDFDVDTKVFECGFRTEGGWVENLCPHASDIPAFEEFEVEYEEDLGGWNAIGKPKTNRAVPFGNVRIELLRSNMTKDEAFEELYESFLQRNFARF